MRNEKHKTHQQNNEWNMEITNHNNNKYSFSLSSNSGFLFLKALTLWLMKRSSVVPRPISGHSRPSQPKLFWHSKWRQWKCWPNGQGVAEPRNKGGVLKKELHGCASAMNPLQVLGCSLSGVRVELASGLVHLYRHGCIVFARSQHSAYHPVLSFLEKWRNTTERDSIQKSSSWLDWPRTFLTG